MAHTVTQGCGCSYEIEVVLAVAYHNRRHQIVEGSLKRCSRHAAQWKRIVQLSKRKRPVRRRKR